MSPARVGEPLALLDQRADEAMALRLGEIAIVLQDLRIGADGGDQRQDVIARLGQERILAEPFADQVGAGAGLAIGAVERQDGVRRHRAGRDDVARIFRAEPGAGQRRIAAKSR